jgi:ribosome-associated translation inhibitor RaiA
MNEIAAAPRQVTFKGINPSSTVSSLIRVCFEKIELRVGTIDHAHVVIGPADPFRVTIDLGYRHHHIFVAREDEDVFAAIESAMDVVERQMLDLKRRAETIRNCA